MLSNISYTSLEGVFFLVLMIFFGKAFRENWKMKNTVVSNSWLFPLKRCMTPLVTSTNGFPEIKLMLSGSTGDESLVDLKIIKIGYLFLVFFYGLEICFLPNCQLQHAIFRL